MVCTPRGEGGTQDFKDLSHKSEPFRWFWIPPKIPTLTSTYPKKYLQIFQPQKKPKLKISNPKKSHDHPCHLKSGVSSLASRVVKSSQLPSKIAAYFVSIGQLLCLAFLYRWRFLNKISLDWPLTLTTQLTTLNFLTTLGVCTVTYKLYRCFSLLCH